MRGRPFTRIPWPTGSGSRRRLLVAAMLAVLAVAVTVPAVVTARPSFFSGYSDMQRSYESLQSSAHRGIACVECHAGEEPAARFRLASIAEFYRSLASRSDGPVLVRMATPTREECLRCHGHDWSDEATRTMKIPHPAHLRVANEKRDCVECHKWTAHEEEYMERHKTMPFSGVCVSFGCHVGTKSADECRYCHHALDENQDEWRSSHRLAVQQRGPGTCLEACHEVEQCRDCHTAGNEPDVDGPRIETGFQALQRAHAEPDWLEQHGPEALENQERCSFCHVSTGECDQCHARRPAFHDPQETWLVEHKKHAEDERGCLTCHETSWCEECHDQFEVSE